VAHLSYNDSLPPTTSLVEVLIQLGPEITNDFEVIRSLLERFGITDANPPRDDQVVEIVTTLSQLAAEGTVICDVGSFIRAIDSYVSGLCCVESLHLKNSSCSGRSFELAKCHKIIRLARPSWC